MDSLLEFGIYFFTFKKMKRAVSHLLAVRIGERCSCVTLLLSPQDPAVFWEDVKRSWFKSLPLITPDTTARPPSLLWHFLEEQTFPGLSIVDILSCLSGNCLDICLHIWWSSFLIMCLWVNLYVFIMTETYCGFSFSRCMSFFISENFPLFYYLFPEPLFDTGWNFDFYPSIHFPSLLVTKSPFLFFYNGTVVLLVKFGQWKNHFIPVTSYTDLLGGVNAGWINDTNFQNNHPT